MWLYIGSVWMGIFLLAFTAIGFVANKKSLIHFSDEGIVYPSFPLKKYAWSEVSQVVWKDDVLTIDLKNNKLLQLTIEDGFAKRFDYNAFNEWCSKKK